MINYKPCKKHMHITSKLQGARYMIWNHSQAQRNATQQFINNNNESHVHIINKKTRINFLCSLTHFRGFQNYGIVRDLDVMLQGQPHVKSDNYNVLTCLTKKIYIPYSHVNLQNTCSMLTTTLIVTIMTYTTQKCLLSSQYQLKKPLPNKT